MDMNSLC